MLNDGYSLEKDGEEIRSSPDIGEVDQYIPQKLPEPGHQYDLYQLNITENFLEVTARQNLQGNHQAGLPAENVHKTKIPIRAFQRLAGLVGLITNVLKKDPE